jgi:hypothetical protein
MDDEWWVAPDKVLDAADISLITDAGERETVAVMVRQEDAHTIRAVANHLDEYDVIDIDLHEPDSLDQLKAFLERVLKEEQ